MWFLFYLHIYSILQYKDLSYVEFVESEISLFIQYTYYELGNDQTFAKYPCISKIVNLRM